MATVSVNQLSALIDFLESNRELALGYSSRSRESRSQVRRLWEQCSTVLNSVSANCMQKTPEQWRLYYSEYKSKLSQKIRMQKAEMSEGEGTSRSIKLTPLQERLYDVLGRDIGDPLPRVRHIPLAVSQSHNSEGLVEVVQIPLAENSQNLEFEMVQIVDDGEGIVVDPMHQWEILEFEPQQLSEVRPSMSEESNSMPEPSPPSTTHAPRQADSPAPRQADSPAPRQADSPASRQADSPAPRQADSPASRQADSPASRQADSPASRQADSPASRQDDSPASRQADSPASRQADSPASRQADSPASRRRRRRVQRSPRLVNSGEHDSLHEASAGREAMDHISAGATRELAQATQRLAAAFEAVAERLREPIIIVLQNPPQARPEN